MLRLPRDTVLMPIDWQQAIDHPKWGGRNNPEAVSRTAELLAQWRAVDVHALSLANMSGEYATISDSTAILASMARWRMR